jgi:outer membrane protein assembly factor BamB
LGTPTNEFGYDVAVDFEGNAFVTGTTTGQLGDLHYRSYDAYIAKYSPSGDVLWIKQFPDAIGDRGTAVTVDTLGNLYLAGTNEGGSQEFLAKLDAQGNVQWRQVINYSTMPGQRTGISKIESDSEGNVYVTGLTNGVYTLGSGLVAYDPVIAKHDASGNLIWQRTLDTNELASYTGIDIDGSGNIYLSGYNGARIGPDDGATDAFWVKYDSFGNLLWTEQLGTADVDYGLGIAADATGRVYLTGSTQWNVNNNYLAESDVLLARFDLVPEPDTSVLLASAIAFLSGGYRRRGVA